MHRRHDITAARLRWGPKGHHQIRQTPLYMVSDCRRHVRDPPGGGCTPPSAPNSVKPGSLTIAPVTAQRHATPSLRRHVGIVMCGA